MFKLYAAGDSNGLREILAADDWPELDRMMAAKMLGRLDAVDARTDLIVALSDVGPPVRAAAASALRKLGAAPAVEELAHVAADPDELDWVRSYAIEALVSVGDGRAVSGLIALAKHGHVWRRRWAVKQLGELRAIQTAKVIEDARKRDNILHRHIYRRALRRIRAAQGGK